MSAPDNVYRATDPDSVKASLDRWQEERAAFFDRVEEFSRDHLGGIELIVVGNRERMWADHLGEKIHGETVDGMPVWTPDGLRRQFGDRDLVANIPAGWHFYVKDREVRPYRGGRDANSKAAVAAVAELNKTSPGDVRAWLNREFSIDLHGYGFEKVGDDWFVLKATGWITTNWDGNEHFEKVPMSTYWLAKEQAEAGAA